jgi:hypothetical protein
MFPSLAQRPATCSTVQAVQRALPARPNPDHRPGREREGAEAVLELTKQRRRSSLPDTGTFWVLCGFDILCLTWQCLLESFCPGPAGLHILLYIHACMNVLDRRPSVHCFVSADGRLQIRQHWAYGWTSTAGRFPHCRFSSCDERWSSHAKSNEIYRLLQILIVSASLTMSPKQFVTENRR